jgi:hypothetical protein
MAHWSHVHDQFEQKFQLRSTVRLDEPNIGVDRYTGPQRYRLVHIQHTINW